MWDTKSRPDQDQIGVEGASGSVDVRPTMKAPKEEGSLSRRRVTDALSKPDQVQQVEVLDDSLTPPLVEYGTGQGLEHYTERSTTTGGGLHQPRSPGLRVTTTSRENGKGVVNGNMRSLFPIFGKRGQQHVDISIPDFEKTREKEASGPGTMKTGRADTRPNRTNALKCTASGGSKASKLEPSCNGTLVGSSPQSLYSDDIMEYIPDGNIPGPSTPHMAKGSQEEPIIIESSPVRDTAEHETLVHSTSPTKLHRPARGEVANEFFAPRKRCTSSTTFKRRAKDGEGGHAKWPDKDNQHVRGAQTSYAGSSTIPPGSRPKPRKEDPSVPLSTSISHLRIDEASHRNHEPRYLVEAIDSQAERHAKCENVLRSSTSCPAISRFLTTNCDATESSWNEKWRPRRADEVIGNNESVVYLRDWLVALEIRTDGQAPADDVEIPAGSRNKSSQGIKRPQITRSVDKPRKRRKRVDSDEESLGDWITSDEEDTATRAFTFIEEVEEGFSDGDTESGSPWKPKLTRLSRRRRPDSGYSDDQANVNPLSVPRQAHDFSGRLTNAILLAGPTGSGKTGAVYACAEELGWEVFEVYPGIGKRNGTSLLSLVGDVGKNHIVNRASRGASSTHEKHLPASSMLRIVAGGNKSASQETASQVSTSFFSQSHEASVGSGGDGLPKSEYLRVDLNRQGASQLPSAAHIRTSPESSVTRNRSATPLESLESRRIGARQSIILLEEVDILFGEDVNFWPTVVALIRESRRPVIMTCNDLSLVPSDSLPLQTILTFNPCPPDSAVPYLQCMTLAEGYAVPETHVKSLYGRRYYPDVLDKPNDLVRTLTCPSSPPDLRRAINSLQFFCQGCPGSNDIEPPPSSTTSNQSLSTDFVLDELCSWNWCQKFTSDFLPVCSEQADGQRKHAHGISRLWQISDSLSMINSCLARKPLANLELHSYSTGSPSDTELGYQYLEFASDPPHLQDGIVQYNLDEVIAREAAEYAKRAAGNNAANLGTGLMGEIRTDERWKGTNMELLLESTGHFARVSGVLEKIVPVAIRQSVDGLILDYEPWVRMIDRSDMELEAAAVKESETRRGARGGRSTRNSQRAQYQRYFDLDEEERNVWQASGLP